jgi:hypothetical protein
MAYNFSAVQRLSDGKYLCVCGDWRTLDFTSNYTAARFYYSDADDVSNYIGGYPVGDYRVVEYWMPGSTSTNKPFSNNTLLGNFAGSLYQANSMTIDSARGETFTSTSQAFINAVNAALANRVIPYLVFTQAEVDSYGVVGAVLGNKVAGASTPTSYYLNIFDYDGRDFYVGGFFEGDPSGQSFQYEVL